MHALLRARGEERDGGVRARTDGRRPGAVFHFVGGGPSASRVRGGVGDRLVHERAEGLGSAGGGDGGGERGEVRAERGARVGPAEEVEELARHRRGRVGGDREPVCSRLGAEHRRADDARLRRLVHGAEDRARDREPVRARLDRARCASASATEIPAGDEAGCASARAHASDVASSAIAPPGPPGPRDRARGGGVRRGRGSGAGAGARARAASSSRDEQKRRC